MAKDNVAISAAMSDKELLDSIDKTLKQAEQRFDSFAAKAVSSMSTIEKASFTAGANIGKNMSDGLDQSTNKLIDRLHDITEKIGAVSPKKDGDVTLFTVNVNELDAAITKAGTLNDTFKGMASSTSQINKNLKGINTVRSESKAATEESRITLETAKQEKYHKQALLYRRQSLDIAQRIAKAEARSRIVTAGTNYDSAMGMSAKTIQERMDKMKALQIVQRSLSADDANYAVRLQAVNKELLNLKRANQIAESAGANLQKSNNKLAESFANLGKRVIFYTGLGAITGFARSLLEVRGQYELLERSIGAVLGDFEKGSQIFRQQQDMALKSPFTVLDLASATKQLAAYNFAAEELVDTSRRLADISAALGVPMERLTYNLGQIKAQTVLMARDARDFANAGLPITQELANMYSELEGRVVSVGEVMDRMSNRMVSFGDVMKVINRYTNEGGMFFDFQAKQAQTLAGQLSNLTDAYNNMLNEMGAESQGLLSGLIGASRSILENWRLILDVVTALITAYGTFKAFQLVTLAMQAKQVASTFKWVTYTNVLREAWHRTGKAIMVAEAAQEAAAQKGQKLNKTLMTLAKNPYAMIAAAIAAVGFALYRAYENATKLQRELDEIMNSGVRRSDKLVEEFDSLTRKLNQATVGTKTFDETLKKINSTYGDYLPNMLTEINYAKELAQNYDLVVKAINDKAKAQTLEKGMQAIEEKYGGEQTELISELLDILDTYKKIPADDGQAIISLFLKNREEGIKNNETVLTTFAKAANKYLDSSEDLFKISTQRDADVNRAIYEYTEALYKSVEQQNNAVERLREVADARFNNVSYNSKAEGAEIDKINEKYKDLSDTQENLLAKLKEMKTVFEKYGDSFNLDKVTKQINSLTVDLEGWKKTVNDIAASAPKGAGAGLSVKPDENSVDYIERLKKSYQELLAQRKTVAGTETDDKTKQRIEEQIAVILRISTALKVNLNTQKQINKEENEETKLLKQRLSLIKDIAKSNEELVKKTGSLTIAAEKTKEAYQGMFDELLKGKGIKFEDVLSFNPASISKIYDELAKGLKSDQAKKALDKQRAEFMIEYSVQINTASVKAAERTIEGLFKGYELDLNVQEAGQFGSLFQSLFDYDPVSLEQLNNDVTAMLEDLEAQISDFNERKGILTNLIETTADPSVVKAYQAELGKMEELESNTAKYIAKTRKELNATNAKYYADNFKVYQKIYNQFATYEDKRAEIERNRLQEQASLQAEVQREMNKRDEIEAQMAVTTDPEQKAKLQKSLDDIQSFLNKNTLTLSVAIDNKAKQEQAKLDFDTFRETELYQKSFEDMANISTHSLDMLIVALDELKDKVGTSLSPTDMKTFMNAYKQVRSELEGRDILGSLVNGAKEWIAASKEVSQLKRQLKTDNDALAAANDKVAEAEANLDPENDIQSLIAYEQALQDQRDATEAVEATTEDLSKAEDEQAEKKEKTTKAIKNAAQAIEGLNSIMTQMVDLLGIAEDSEAGQAMQAFSEGLTMVTSALGIASAAIVTFGTVAAPVLAIGAAVAAVIGSILFFSGKKNRSINKQIEKSELAVKRLENAYKGLQNEIEKAYGDAEVGARRAAIANQQLQLIELKRQLALEKSRKKKDQDAQRIAELEGMIKDTEIAIENAMTEIIDSIMGTDAKSAAESFVSSMIDSFKNGEDWMASFSDSFDEMVDNMIMKAIVGRILGDKMQDIWDTIDERINNRTKSEQEAYKKASQNAQKTDEELKKDLSSYLSRPITERDVERLKNQYKAQEEKALKELQKASALNVSDIETARLMGEDLKSYLQNNFSEWMEMYGIKFGESAGSQLSGLQKGISSISESTAESLEALLNHISGQTFQQTALQQQMVNLMTLNSGTSSQILLSLRAEFQILQSLQLWATNITTAAGNGINVRILPD